MKSFPPLFLQSLSSCPGFNEKDFVQVHEHESRITSIRLNPFKKTTLDFPLGAAVPWCTNAFYLDERPSFTYDPLFHAGAYYVQEAGSMFLEHALKSHLNFSQDLKILDLCAAPGGKSTLINSLISPESLLVSNEVIKKRAGILSQNMGRWGTDNAVVLCNEAKTLGELHVFFDVVVVDAPCSGSGLFRKQPEAMAEWSPSLVNMCRTRQKDILREIYPAIKEEGILVYSTCSYSVEENEELVKWMREEFAMDYLTIPLKQEWNIVETDNGYRFYPDKTLSEGFFIAVLRKKENSGARIKLPKQKNILLKKEDLTVISSYLEQKTTNITKIGDFFHLMNSSALEFHSAFQKQLYFRKAGLTLGEMKGKDLVPQQDLAWYNGVNAGLKEDLTAEEAISYLRKDILNFERKTLGFRLFTYKGLGLGWAKIMKDRINNYLPSELRILN